MISKSLIIEPRVYRPRRKVAGNVKNVAVDVNHIEFILRATCADERGTGALARHEQLCIFAIFKGAKSTIISGTASGIHVANANAPTWWCTWVRDLRCANHAMNSIIGRACAQEVQSRQVQNPECAASNGKGNDFL